MIAKINQIWSRISNPLGKKGEAKTLAALLRLSAELATPLEEADVCHCVVQGLHDTLGYDYVALLLLDEETGDRVRVAGVGYNKSLVRLAPGQGLSARALLDGQLHYTPDVRVEPTFVPGIGGSEVDVPIRISGRVLGVLVAESRKFNDFNSDDFEVLTAAAQQVGLALEKVRLIAAERQRADELNALYTTLADITTDLELSSLLQVIVERAAGLLDATGGELGFYDEDQKEIQIVVSYNLGGDYVHTRQAYGEGAMGRVVETGQPLILEDYSSWEGRLHQYPDIHATLAVPLQVGRRLVGVFTTVSTEPGRRFSQADLHLLNLFAQQAAIAIDNARLFEKAQQEIAERVKIEAEIMRQKEYFEALFFYNPVAVVTADLEGVIVSWNPMAEKLFGYSQEEAVGKPLDDIVASHESIYQEAQEFTKQVINIGQVHATVKRTHKDGSWVEAELLALPVVVSGETIGFIVIYYDISDLQKARRQAEAANHAKSVFLANMSHELRTPLNAILGFTQLMAHDSNLTTSQQENLGIINRSSEHLLTLINSVLDMSKIEAGRLTIQEKGFDLYLLLDTLEDIFRLRVQQKGLELIIERHEGLPRYIVSDDGKLRQVLMNLIGNAIKFTQSGGVSLTVSATPIGESPDPDKMKLYFEIEDTGPGIAPEDLEAIFEPFVQAPDAPQYHEGTGLGLSISRQFVHMMGGEINATSTIGQGSLFAFDILVALSGEDAIAASQLGRRVLALQPGQPVYRLLVVEDRESNRQLLVKLLQPLGFDVAEAANGLEAIELWERWEPHLIWMDMRMPHMDGYETTRQIKSSPKGGDTVIIALTATAFKEDRQRILSIGCDDFLRKPFQQEEIFNALTEHLGVGFVYADEEPHPLVPGPFTTQVEKPGILTLESMASLSPDLIADLEREIIRAELRRIHDLIDKIRQDDKALADALFELVNDFKHDQILDLIDQIKGEYGDA